MKGIPFLGSSSLSSNQKMNQQLLSVLTADDQAQESAVQHALFGEDDFDEDSHALKPAALKKWQAIKKGDEALTFEQLHVVLKALNEKGLEVQPGKVQTKAGQPQNPFANKEFYDFMRQQQDIVPGMREELRLLRERVKNERGFLSRTFNIFRSEKPLAEVTKDVLAFEKHCKRYGITFDDVNKGLAGGDRAHPAFTAVKDFRFMLAAVGGGLLGLAGYTSGVDIMSHLPEAAGQVPGMFFKGLPYVALPFISLSIFRAFSEKSILKEAPTVGRFVGTMGIGIMIGLGVTAALGGWLPDIDPATLEQFAGGGGEGADGERPFSPSQYILHGIIGSAIFATLYRKTKPQNGLDAAGGKSGLAAVFNGLKTKLNEKVINPVNSALRPVYNAVSKPINSVGKLTEKAADGMDWAFNQYMNYVGVPAITIMMTALMNKGGMGELANYGGYYGVMGACMATCAVVLGGLAYVHGARGAEFKEFIKTGTTAFGISSSAATMPVTKEGLKKMGVPSHIRESVVPLGANFNMMGTAMFLGGTAICAAKMMGLEPSFWETMAAMGIAVSTAFGAPGAPASMVIFLDPVLSKMGLSQAQAAEIYKMIIPGERLLDMTQTAQNVTGDQIVALNTEAYEKNKGWRRFIPFTREHPSRALPSPSEPS